jgi:hypothetical protein
MGMNYNQLDIDERYEIYRLHQACLHDQVCEVCCEFHVGRCSLKTSSFSNQETKEDVSQVRTYSTMSVFLPIEPRKSGPGIIRPDYSR